MLSRKAKNSFSQAKSHSICLAHTFIIKFLGVLILLLLLKNYATFEKPEMVLNKTLLF
jgi:hypothetical protein